jgi:hypothetical protein
MKLRMPLTERLRRRREEKPGQAVIEMALVMTVLLILSFGMADFGLLLTAEIQATNCAREIARRAVVRDETAVDACADYSALNALTNDTVTVDLPAYMDLDSGVPITARIEGTYHFIAIAPLLNAFFPGDPFPADSTVGSETTMRMEGRRP